jgi:hypothetical protein
MKLRVERELAAPLLAERLLLDLLEDLVVGPWSGIMLDA